MIYLVDSIYCCDYPDCDKECTIVKTRDFTDGVLRPEDFVKNDTGRRCLEHAPKSWIEELKR